MPRDFDIRFDAGQALVTRLAGAFRALIEMVDDIAENVVPGAPAAMALVAFFKEPVPTISSLNSKSFTSLVASKIPSSNRVVELLMNALGLDLVDLADAANASILDAVTTARDAVDSALDNLPSCLRGIWEPKL